MEKIIYRLLESASVRQSPRRVSNHGQRMIFSLLPCLKFKKKFSRRSQKRRPRVVSCVVSTIHTHTPRFPKVFNFGFHFEIKSRMIVAEGWVGERIKKKVYFSPPKLPRHRLCQASDWREAQHPFTVPVCICIFGIFPIDFDIVSCPFFPVLN